MRLCRALLLALLVFLSAGTRDVSAAPVAQPVDRDAAEASFLSACEFFYQNRLWDCLDQLLETQKQNTYFIDTYYLKGLAMRRLGRYPDAMEAMKAYLEVRHSDHRAQLILNAMKEEWRILEEILRPPDILTELRFRGSSLNSLFGVSVSHPLSFSGMSGLGKLSSFEKYLFAPDTLGNNFWVFDTEAKLPMMQLPIASPVVAVPLSLQEILLLQKSGDVRSIRIDRTARTLSERFLGHVEANVADAAAVSSSLIAVADRTGQSVKFRKLPSLDAVSEWRPKDDGKSKKLFEPVALAAYGPLLAVADRGNSVVYVLDSYTLAVRDRFEVGMPRDLEWGNQGELYVLTENGELYSRYPAEEKAGAAATRAVTGMKQAWSLAWTHEGPIAADVSGRWWWNSKLFPGHDVSIGMIALREPWIEGERGEETLFLRGKVSSVYNDFVKGNVPAADAVWRNEVRSSRVTEVCPMEGESAVFYTPAGDSGDSGRRGLKSRRAGTFDELWADLAASSRAGDELPRVIVLDSRVEVPEGRFPAFLSFLLHQGIRLDLWALGRPASAAAVYLSRSTQGNTYYAENVGTIPGIGGIEWIVSVLLPPETVSFGLPTDATLSLFASVGVLRFNDWVPIWPSLVKRK